MTPLNILSVLIVLVMLFYCETHKILVVSHLPIKSHAILSHVLVKLLLEVGHEITQITMIPINRTHPSLRQIDVSYNEKYFRDNNLHYYADISKKIFTSTLIHKDVAVLLRDTTQKFDLVIAEWMFNDLCIGLAALYDCPLIWFSAIESNWKILQLIEQTTNQADTPSGIAKSVQPFAALNLMREAHLDSLDKEAFSEIFGPLMDLRGKPLPSYVDLLYLCSMVFVYSPVLIGDSSKWPQNFKPIGGYHIARRVKPLEKDLKSIMDNAKYGVIYFSLGSHLNSKDLPAELKRKLIEIFSGLKQTILWKYESEFSHLPSNVRVMKWAPQQTHPNCIIFITQGGVLSMTEAVYYGIPVVGVPIFGDQFTNTQRAVENGFAIKVELTNAMAEQIKDAIEEMLRNPSYRNKVKEYSSIYHNRPMSPRVEVVHWVNHAIRKGVSHPNANSSHEMPYIKIAVLVVIVTTIIKFMLRWRTTVTRGISKNY